MKRVLLMMALLVLVACGPAGGETPTPTAAVSEPAPVATLASAATPEKNDAPTATLEEPATTTAAADVDTGDFAVSATPDEAAIVRTYDNTEGATEPLVIIIEYGDFQ